MSTVDVRGTMHTCLADARNVAMFGAASGSVLEKLLDSAPWSHVKYVLSLKHKNTFLCFFFIRERMDVWSSIFFFPL